MYRCYRFFPLVLAIFSCVPASADLFVARDGARHTRELRLRQGRAELRLPADYREGTLRVLPVAGVALRHVAVTPGTPNREQQRHLDGLVAERERLQARLQSLEAAESVYRDAARSQSSRAPKRSRANPEPLQAVRQGTDFALARLEAVLLARQQAAARLSSLDERLAALRRAAQAPLVAITATPAKGLVRVEFASATPCWQPTYELRDAAGQAPLLALVASLPAGLSTREKLAVVPGSLEEGRTPLPLPPGSERLEVSRWLLPAPLAPPGGASQVPLPATLPAGPLTWYLQGVYRATVHFPGGVAGGVAELLLP